MRIVTLFSTVLALVALVVSLPIPAPTELTLHHEASIARRNWITTAFKAITRVGKKKKTSTPPPAAKANSAPVTPKTANTQPDLDKTALWTKITPENNPVKPWMSPAQAQKAKQDFMIANRKQPPPKDGFAPKPARNTKQS